MVTSSHSLTLSGVLDGELEPAGPLRDEWVVRIVVSLAQDLDLAEAVEVVHVGLAFPLKNNYYLRFDPLVSPSLLWLPVRLVRPNPDCSTARSAG